MKFNIKSDYCETFWPVNEPYDHAVIELTPEEYADWQRAAETYQAWQNKFRDIETAYYRRPRSTSSGQT